MVILYEYIFIFLIYFLKLRKLIIRVFKKFLFRGNNLFINLVGVIVLFKVYFYGRCVGFIFNM